MACAVTGFYESNIFTGRQDIINVVLIDYSNFVYFPNGQKEKSWLCG